MSKKNRSNSGAYGAAELNTVLASTYVLYLKTQNFHWNVEGEHFLTLHAMFQTQYEELAAAIDDIAERIRGLGFYAPGGMKAYASLSVVKDAPEKQLKALDMVADLVKSHDALIKVLKQALDEADDRDDEVTEDLLIQRLAVHEKTRWMLKSMLVK